MSEKWTTHDELLFLERMKREKPQVLQAYKESIHLREDWGDISEAKVKEFLGVQRD